MGSHSTLQTDDGTPLTPKEGVIIDTEGRPLTPDLGRESEKLRFGGTFGGNPKFKIISFGKLSWPIAAFVVMGLIVLIPILIMASFVFLGLLLVRTLFRALT